MRIIPVIDLLNGVVVRAVAGNRAIYSPIQSKLVDSSDPLFVARALRNRVGHPVLYVADLDAIAGQSANWAIYSQLIQDGFELWLDAGIDSESSLARLSQLEHGRLILGLESLESPELFSRLLELLPRDRLIFSLDLKAGIPIASTQWHALFPAAESLARWVLTQGIERMILLDLSRVGMQSGPGTESLYRSLRIDFPAVEFILGGGIRDRQSLESLTEMGVNSVLVASALHDGDLP